MRVIDLTYTVSDKMVVWPGNQRPIFEWKKRANSDPCNVSRINMEAHTGTHVDSPLHFLIGGQTIDTIPVDRFFGKARLFRFKEQPEKQEISLKTVLDSGFSMSGAHIFVMDTGVSALAEQRDYNYKYPVPDFDLLEWLVKSGVKSYMTDATSIDHFEMADDSPRHKTLFAAGMPVVENLAKLGDIPENADFVISAMPLKLEGREGSPCRAAAWLE